MTVTVEAVYEDGVIKPTRPLPFREHEKVQITILQESSAVQEALDAVQRSYGLIGWTGDPEVVRRVAEDIEFSILESRSPDNWVEQTAGICRFTGSVEDADRFASDADVAYPSPREEP